MLVLMAHGPHSSTWFLRLPSEVMELVPQVTDVPHLGTSLGQEKMKGWLSQPRLRFQPLYTPLHCSLCDGRYPSPPALNLAFLVFSKEYVHFEAHAALFQVIFNGIILHHNLLLCLEHNPIYIYILCISWCPAVALWFDTSTHKLP